LNPVATMDREIESHADNKVKLEETLRRPLVEWVS